MGWFRFGLGADLFIIVIGQLGSVVGVVLVEDCWMVSNITINKTVKPSPILVNLKLVVYLATLCGRDGLLQILLQRVALGQIAGIAVRVI